MPEWLKPAAWGTAVGAVILAIVAFSTDTVVFKSMAVEMAAMKSEKAVVAALVPICVAQSKQDPQRTKQFAALKAEDPWNRSDLLKKIGWATMPGSKDQDPEITDAVANECMFQLKKFIK